MLTEYQLNRSNKKSLKQKFHISSFSFLTFGKGCMKSLFNTFLFIFQLSSWFRIFLKKALYTLLLFFLVSQISCSSKEQKKTTPKVFVEKTPNGYQLIRNGKPFIIKGSGGNSFFSELKMAGGNTIRIYDTLDLQQHLDRADSLGLAVIVDIPLPRFVTPDTIYNSKETMARLYRGTKKLVNTYKDHPALLYWMLGNEIKYPDLPGNRNLENNFNGLIEMIHEVDGDHPVSTAIAGFDRRRILSMVTMSGSLDLISINIFGELSTFNKRKKNMHLLWSGPYVFSEYGINGPWEADKTLWGAPIEETSTKKAEHYVERFNNYIKPIDDGRCLGSLTFYWGQKQERTHTWFSTFILNDKKTQGVFEMENLWKGKNEKFKGPEIDYMLLNGKGAKESIVLNPSEKATSQLFLLKNDSISQFKTTWEIRPEHWNYFAYEKVKTPEKMSGLVLKSSRSELLFVIPKEEGPYRLFVSIEGENGYVATANIPFYVLNPGNGS